MTNDHPVQLDVTSPDHFERIQLLLRFVLSIALAWLGVTAGWLGWLLYLFLPVAAAIAIPSREFGPQLWRVLRWLLELSAYMLLLTDRFPTADGDRVRVDIRFTAQPTVRSALGRLVTSIPSAFVLCLLSIVSGVLCIVAIVFVLFGSPIPHGILAYQRGMLRWQARLLAYHASLVDEYPPFSLETDDSHRAAAAAAR